MNQVSSPGPAASATSGDSIGAAARELSDASYPFLKSVDWTSNIYLKPLRWTGVTSQADWEAVNAALGRGIASVPESTVMGFCSSFSAITDSGAPAHLRSTVNGTEAEKA